MSEVRTNGNTRSVLQQPINKERTQELRRLMTMAGQKGLTKAEINGRMTGDPIRARQRDIDRALDELQANSEIRSYRENGSPTGTVRYRLARFVGPS